VPGPPVFGPDSVRVHLRRDAGRLGPSTGPWIRARQVAKINGPARPETIVEIVDRRDETIGWGLYSEASSIAVRVIAWSSDPPPTDWLQTRIERAVRARTCLGFGGPLADGYRVINSEGDGLPGLVVDRYGEDAVIQVTTAPMLARRADIVDCVRAQLPVTRVHVLVPESAAKHEGITPDVAIEGSPGALTFHEGGLRFMVDPPPTHKTGAYFDQRDNRRRFADLVKGKRVLDICAAPGGKTMQLASAGWSVTSVDSSESRLARLRENLERTHLTAVLEMHYQF